MTSVRCFVAAELPPDVLDDLCDLQDRLQRGKVRARWVRREAMHLTLKFMGELDPERYERLDQILAQPLAEPPVELRTGALGAFPHPGRARVLWLGVTGDVAGLARVAAQIDERAGRVGVAREVRPFRPHLTLGRAGGTVIQGAQRGLERIEAPPERAFEVGEVFLIESRLRPGGPEYLPRRRIPLGNAAPSWPP